MSKLERILCTCVTVLTGMSDSRTVMKSSEPVRNPSRPESLHALNTFAAPRLAKIRKVGLGSKSRKANKQALLRAYLRSRGGEGW